MKTIIEFKNVSKQYGRTKVIDNVSFGVRQNSVCGFVGPNGAGKTTIIKLILGITNADSGNMILHMESGSKSGIIGAIVSGPSFYGHLNAYQNMQIVAGMKQITAEKEEIMRLLSLVGLESVGKKKVKHFSMGMKQRLNIAFSLLGNPKLLIWDEPLNGLDPEGIVEIRQIIREIKQKTDATFLMSSHILSELDKVADQIILINRGKILYNNDFIHFLNDYGSDNLEESYMRCIAEAAEKKSK